MYQVIVKIVSKITSASQCATQRAAWSLLQIIEFSGWKGKLQNDHVSTDAEIFDSQIGDLLAKIEQQGNEIVLGE